MSGDVRVECDGVSLVCPENMVGDVRRILQDGEYSLPIDFSIRPTILDIGANVGAFALWAAKRWNAEAVYAYEPHPGALEYLRKNTASYAEVFPLAEAVTGASSATKLRIFTGKNLGCSSSMVLSDAPGNLLDDFVEADCIQASKLPRAHVVKVDTEGHEVAILRDYDLSGTNIVFYEWHRREDRPQLWGILQDAGFTLYSGVQRAPWLGVERWVRE